MASKTQQRTPTAKVVAQQKQRVIDAVHEILHNPQTPADLFEHVAEFVNDILNSSRGSDQIHHHPTVLTVLLGTYTGDELMGERHERHAKEDAAREEGQS